MSNANRREFLKTTAAGAGLLLLTPVVTSCGGATVATESEPPVASEIPPLPTSRPSDWDPVSFNRVRGNAGAIPEVYRAAINGPDGATKHIGKHLPYLVTIDPELVPAGYVAIMWGDASKGYAQHPNSARNDETGFAGHWFSWVRIRKATDGAAEEQETNFDNWPVPGNENAGAFAVLGGGDIGEDSGKRTVYLAQLPSDIAPGDTIRVWGFCLNHGEYADFVTLNS
jgi:hypothetical protein